VSHLIVNGVKRHLKAVRPSRILGDEPHFAAMVAGGGLAYACAPVTDLFRMVPFVFDQGEEGSCVFNAAVMLAVLRYVTIGKHAPDLSRQFLYWCGRVDIDGSPADQDVGAEGLTGLKALEKFGVCLETMWPYTQGDFARRPSTEAYDDASLRQALRWYSLYPNVSGTSTDWIRAALTAGYGCTLSIAAFRDELLESCSTGICDLPPDGATTDEGHCMAILGHDDGYVFPSGAVGAFWALQSWGAAVGLPLFNGSQLRGRIAIPYAYFDRGYAYDPGTLHAEEII